MQKKLDKIQIKFKQKVKISSTKTLQKSEKSAQIKSS